MKHWNIYIIFLLILSISGSCFCGYIQGSVCGSRLFLIYDNDIGEAVKSSCSCELAIHSLFIKIHLWEKIKIEKKSLKDFENLFDWFDDNKLGIHFGDDKAKSFPFASKQNKLETTTEKTNYLNQNFVGCPAVYGSSHILTTTWYQKKIKKWKGKYKLYKANL